MSQDDERISVTAYYTGEAWNALGFAHAPLFSTQRGRALFAAYRLLERMRGANAGPSILVRTLYNRHATIDRAIRALAADRLVEIGAGLSPRGVAFAVDDGVDVVDFDLPAMVAVKRALLESRALPAVRARVAERYRLDTIDVTAADFRERLRSALTGAKRPVVVAEGLVGYFARDVQEGILRNVREALEVSSAGSFLVDLRVGGHGDSKDAHTTLRLGQRIVTRGRPGSPQFDSEADAAALFARAGFATPTVLPLIDEGSPRVLARVFHAGLRDGIALH